MLPNKIINIIDKYSDNDKIIDKINTSLKDIKLSLNAINKNIAQKAYYLMLDEHTNNNNLNELNKDSEAMRDFIKSIKYIKIKDDDQNIQLELPIPMFDKTVGVYLISDELCPFCNVKLSSHKIYYQRISDNILHEEDVTWHRCPNCRNMFALDFNVEDFDFNNTNIALNKSQYLPIPDININSLVVLSNTLKCSSKHKTQDCCVKIPILDENGTIFYKFLSAAYCQICNRYTILKEDFDKITGVILCKVEDETQPISYSSYDNDFIQEQNKSILTKYGYNVQTKKSLSKIQRQIILSSLIEAQILSRREIIDHISTLIERGSKIPSWCNAVQKWIEDKNYVKDYDKEKLPEVIFDKIILKYKKSDCNQ